MKEPANILVVDDNSDLLNTFALILKRKGYLVDTAGDGVEALRKFNDHKFDVILMDVIMPKMNGIETLHKMKEINPKAKVILMTAYCEQSQLENVMNEGAYKALYKPINISNLMDLLAEATGSPFVLVVDDDDSFRQTLASMLEIQKFKVATAASGEEAVRMARQKDFSMAFIDIKMAEMDGLTTSLKLREIRPNMLIVMMTGFRDEVKGIVDEATHNGVLKCLYKPFDITAVKDVVSRAI
jgi:DNA-binding NtrC family response regulator